MRLLLALLFVALVGCGQQKIPGPDDAEPPQPNSTSSLSPLSNRRHFTIRRTRLTEVPQIGRNLSLTNERHFTFPGWRYSS